MHRAKGLVGVTKKVLENGGSEVSDLTAKFYAAQEHLGKFPRKCQKNAEIFPNVPVLRKTWQSNRQLQTLRSRELS